MTNAALTFLKSEKSLEIFQEIKARGSYHGTLPSDIPADDRAFIIAELYVRTSRYHEIERDLPEDASPWYRRLALCTGRLFTSLALALSDLDELESSCQIDCMRERFVAWRMHLNFLMGNERVGIALRDQVEKTLFNASPWDVEICTLIAISYFSSGNSRKSVHYHLQALTLIEASPDRYFQSFGAAMGIRAALKICDAKSFDIFSAKLEESLAEAFDSRYKLRQLGYRAMILTQLGETEIAKRYWDEGDQLLEKVDPGVATLERAQYLIFRCLAAALLGNHDRVADAYEKASAELNSAEIYDIHRAELEVCRILSPVANPMYRAQNVGATYLHLDRSRRAFLVLAQMTDNESVKIYYEEAADFCGMLLGSKERQPASAESDLWRTLTINIISNYQSFLNFAERIEYFRLIPKFVHEIEHSELTDRGIATALEKVIKITPTITGDKFQIPFDRKEVYKTSQVETLLTFANSLRDLNRRAQKNARDEILADAVQTIAHEFKRPFNLLRTNLNALLKATHPDDIVFLAKTAFPEIAHVTEAVERLLQDVIDTSRSFILEKELVRPSDVVHAAIKTIKDSLGNFKYRVDFKTETTVEVDSSKIISAIANIVENAVQASPTEELWISTRRGYFNKKAATVVTVGSNSYIAPEDRVQIFEKFFSKRSDGSGLGLYIVKRIVEAHGGAVRCRSSVESGTEFDLVLPHI